MDVERKINELEQGQTSLRESQTGYGTRTGVIRMGRKDKESAYFGNDSKEFPRSVTTATIIAPIGMNIDGMEQEHLVWVPELRLKDRTYWDTYRRYETKIYFGLSEMLGKKRGVV